jgi:hypothetical protein
MQQRIAQPLYSSALDSQIVFCGGEGFNCSVKFFNDNIHSAFSTIYEFATAQGPCQLTTRNEVQLARVDGLDNTFVWFEADFNRLVLITESGDGGYNKQMLGSAMLNADRKVVLDKHARGELIKALYPNQYVYVQWADYLLA